MTPTNALAPRKMGGEAFTEAKAQTLATLRDTLFPRLISRQSRLPDAKAPVEAPDFVGWVGPLCAVIEPKIYEKAMD